MNTWMVKTPAEQAKVDYDVKNWKQLSQLPQPKEQAPRQKIDLTGKKLYKRKRGRRVKKEQDIKPSLGTGRL
jgi:hypothetical protein